MKYNILKDKKIELSEIENNTTCSVFKDSSTFLRGDVCKSSKTSVSFNFLTQSLHGIVMPFFITITRKRFPNVYYGYDSTAFCIIRCEAPLKLGVRYTIYGKLSKIKMYFIDCMEATPVDYKELCYWLL